MRKLLPGRAKKLLRWKDFLTKKDKSHKAQAVSELAIVGGLILLGFGALLSYGQMMNSQQSLQMRAFRHALSLSRSRRAVVSYTIVRDSPTIDVKDLFGRPDTSRQVASATVCAIRTDPSSSDPENKDKRASIEYYEIDGYRVEVEPIKVKIKYKKGDYETWVSAPIGDVEYLTLKERIGSLDKRESQSSISTTTRSGRVKSQDTTYLLLEDRGSFKQNYLEDLQDKVYQEPWEKRLEIEKRSRRLVALLEYLVTGVASALWEEYGQGVLDWITDIFGLDYCVQASCGSGLTVKMVIYAAASLCLSELFGYLLFNRSTAEGEAKDVEIVSGYRVKDTLSGTASFSIPEEGFRVSH